MKFNNQISVKLTNQESNFLIELLNNKLELNNISDAIRYCIRKEMQKINTQKEEIKNKKYNHKKENITFLKGEIYRELKTYENPTIKINNPEDIPDELVILFALEHAAESIIYHHNGQVMEHNSIVSSINQFNKTTG